MVGGAEVDKNSKMNDILRGMFIVYFVTHIPISICLDFQVIFGQYYPPNLVALNDWYIANYKDPMISGKPIWLKSFIWAEFLFQLPFFFVATYGLLYKCNWLRIPAIIYGTHVATTVWPLITEFIFSETNSVIEKAILIAFYAPYFAIPLLLTAYMSLHPVPFEMDAPRKDTKNKRY